MMARRKKLLAAMGVIAVVNCALNFAIFIICYNHLATPYLVEAQREDNARFIMATAIWLFAGSGALTGGAAYLACILRGPCEEAAQG